MIGPKYSKETIYQATTAFEATTDYHSLKSLMIGSKKCALSCQSSQKNAVLATSLNSDYQTTMLGQLTANKVTSDFFEKAVALKLLAQELAKLKEE